MKDKFQPHEFLTPKDEIEFRKKIEEYYLPKQLINAILEIGEIPENSEETEIGVGFIDIADYSFLSKFLSPKENQTLLNGLYSAFECILEQYSGYLNKIEGDSLMFQYGGLIDPKVKGMEKNEELRYIAKNLFYSCIDMQKVCFLFNMADLKLLDLLGKRSAKDAVVKAFDIISSMRNNKDLSPSINALFQIRVRIGANIGSVSIGNFGPDGAKHWDAIGLPVINAKRMESTAPIGGLRISEDLFNILEHTGITDEYYEEFKRQAREGGGFFQDITKEELFNFSRVVLKDKNNAVFNTYSVQVSPNLPETIVKQVRFLLEKGAYGVDKVVNFLEYYRGNKLVVKAVEALFAELKVFVRKEEIIKIMLPKLYAHLLNDKSSDFNKVAGYINEKYTLFNIFSFMGQYQDEVKKYEVNNSAEHEFSNFDTYMENEKAKIKNNFLEKKRSENRRAYFYEIVYPVVFKNIKGALLEYQNECGVLEEL